MRTGFAAVVSAIALSACSVVGIRDAPEPHYDVVARMGDVEIRSYGPRIAAETVVDSEEMAARNTGFRRLAGYIFGGNAGATKIAMTAPVEQQAAEGWRIGFFMPPGQSLATLPRPNSANVRLVDVPPATMAVLRFSGLPGSKEVAAKTAALLAALADSAWRPAGPPVAWFYDPPWTLPPLRRNEVAVPVAPR